MEKAFPKNRRFVFSFLLFLLFLLVSLIYFFSIKSKVKKVSLTEYSYQSKLVNDKTEKLFWDVILFLKFTKQNLEKGLNSHSFNEKVDEIYKKTYRKTNRNLVSNYDFVVRHRIKSNKISATYLSKNEILTDEIKNIAVITSQLDNFWSEFSIEHPFLSMSYVDKTGLYREFPFRKIEPVNIGFLSDPRNFPYFSTATTVGKDEVFLTLPYQLQNELYVSFVIPVYQNNNFRGLLTIDISMSQFKEIIKSFQKGIKNKISDVIIYRKNGLIYFFSYEDDVNDMVNFNNLNEFLAKKKTTLAKSIKLYPVIKNDKLISILDNFAKSKKDEEIQNIGKYFVSLKKTRYFDLNILSFEKENVFFASSVNKDIAKAFFFSFLLFLLLLTLSFVYSSENFCDLNELYASLFNGIKSQSLKEKLSDSGVSQKKTDLKNLGKSLSDFISRLYKENTLLLTVFDTINFGILVVEDEIDSNKILFLNKWFRQLIVDAKTIELLPEKLIDEIKKFKESSIQHSQKIIKLFERHYLIRGERLKQGEEGEMGIVVFTISSAENFNQIQKENKELKEMISELSTKLSDFQSSFENLNTKIIQSDKFAVFGELIQGIVHNINNPMMIVSSRLSMVKSIIENMENSVDKRRLVKHISNIIASLKKINDIIDSVLLKAKITVEKEEKLVNVNELIKTEMEFFNADLFFKHKVLKEINLADNVPYIRISQSDFSQVLHNIIKNALDVLKAVPNPKLTVKTLAREGKVIIEIEDNGPGIPDELKEKIFEQYFTTKGSHGTGIGLYNARKIIEEYDGELFVENGENGAKFVIILPSAGGE